MGSTCPKLALLRMDADHTQIWLNTHRLLAVMKMLLGVDPKQDYEYMAAKAQSH